MLKPYTDKATDTSKKFNCGHRYENESFKLDFDGLQKDAFSSDLTELIEKTLTRSDTNNKLSGYKIKAIDVNPFILPKTT
ncbi:hypothetical protein BCV39_03885 [Vibrio sp. 10N.286.55.E10]|nr:hypothetical protein BCV40_15745 [Vibrio sp. 10N.286.55.E12]PME33919.1 hypothetical protein BCV39_03885 [Vibrio sp. 10N.286.55.E10]PME63785.1 hypothetical protein BCV32_03110 [Vibrio sp. 10N.286.55.C11]